MKGTLYIQRNNSGELIKNPEGIEGRLTYAYRHAFLVADDEHIIAELDNARIDDIVVAGVHLSGSHSDLEGRLIYQQWWFRV